MKKETAPVQPDEVDLFRSIEEFVRESSDWPEGTAAAVDDIRGLLRSTPLAYCARRIRNVALPKGRMLEMGCGTGRWAFAMSGSFDEVIGVDLNRDRIRLANHLVDRLNLRNVSFEERSILGLPYADQSFDSVVCYGVLVAGDLLEQALAEIFRVLRPGGAAYITLNGGGWNYMLRDVSSKSHESHGRMGREGVYNTVVSNNFRCILKSLTAAREEFSRKISDSSDPVFDSSNPEHIGHLNKLVFDFSENTISSAYNSTLRMMQREVGDEYVELFKSELTKLLSGTANGFSFLHQPNGYTPEYVAGVSKKIGFVGFDWATEGMLMTSPESVKLRPVYTTPYMNDELVVWDFRVVKRG
jgi:ubiquinone/menaquinone biosynthesis C-methylase UbiE